MQRFVVLDSWRGVCACLVALFHFQLYSHLYDLQLVRNAYLFVDFFFVLSGFVIAANYEQRLAEGLGVGKFMLLRIGRLYPLHLVMLLAFVGFDWFHSLFMYEYSGFRGDTEQRTTFAVLTNFFLVHSLGIHDGDTWNTPSWSISTELYTYLVFAVALNLFRKARLVGQIAIVILGPLAIGMLSKNNMFTSYDYGFIRCVYGFVAGVLVWKVFRGWHAVIAEQLRDTVIANLVEVAVVFLMVVFVSGASTNVFSLFAPYVFMVTVLTFAFEAGWISRVLSCRPLVALGTLSYSIYMVHVFIVERLSDAKQFLQTDFDVNIGPMLGEARRTGLHPWEGDVYYLIYLAIVIVTAYFTYNIIEKPCRDWVRQLVLKPYTKEQ